MSRPQFRPSQYPLWWFLKGLSLLPTSVLYAISSFLYFLIYYVVGYRKKVVRQNLERAFPDKPTTWLRQTEKQFFHNLTDIIIETLKLTSISEKELNKRIQFSGDAAVLDCLNSGKPMLALGAHLGNWEMALLAGSRHFPFPIDGVYKPLSSSFFEVFMLNLRSRFEATLVKNKDTLRHLIRHRNQPRFITMLSDQIPPRGEIQYWTTFLHQDTAFYVGADKLQASFKYPVFFMGMRHLRRGHYEIYFEELKRPANAEEFGLIEVFAQRLEQWVQAYPADYLWSHKRWKHQRPAASSESDNLPLK